MNELPVNRSNRTPSEWTQWLRAGWHQTSAIQWAETWLPGRLEAELLLLDKLAAENPVFEGVVKRERRNTVDRLIRFQYHLPWASKNQSPFARELNVPDGDKLELEHAIPVRQLRAFVLMAIEEDDHKHDYAEAKRRLKFAWLCPTIVASKTTHQAISGGPNRLCKDFAFPLGRYSNHRIKLYHGQELSAQDYRLEELLEDLSAVAPIRPIIESLEGIQFPKTADENERTRASIDRQGHARRREFTLKKSSGARPRT